MRPARDTLVMLLAGGVGSRLNILASERAKPAVPFGGAYRIIDFTLSNVMHSGLQRVGLLTQYRPLSLMDHVRNGEPWDLMGRERGVRILPPHTGRADADWYKGTADAIYQNLDLIHDYEPDKVLILSGDHIYRMDYDALIGAHEARGADITIAALPVPWEETHRFGVMVTDGESWITQFQEKVREAKSNLASMGIYVFDTAVLIEELRRVVGSRRGYDFGKDVIPDALGRRKLLSYPFTGYWRDVGTIKSYHDANMDCLDPESGLDLAAWQIRTGPDLGQAGERPPITLSVEARVSNALVAAGCTIEGEVSRSVIFAGVRIGRGARVRNSIIMQDTEVAEGCQVEDAIIDKQCRIGAGTVIGCGDPRVANRQNPGHLDCGITVIGKAALLPPGIAVGKNCIIHPGTDLRGREYRRIEDGDTVPA